MNNQDRLDACQEILGYRFNDQALLTEALTHASATTTRLESNERLEFLGDAVLGMVICQAIHASEPKLAEGQMTKIKSYVVSRSACARVARRLGLSRLLVLGKGVTSSSRLPGSLAAAVFEAVVGALYLDGGLDAARGFLMRAMADVLETAMSSQHQRNYKSVLQQYAQREWNVTPSYELLDEKGPQHAKCFEVAVRIGDRQYPSAWGSFKKLAEQKAALAALRQLGVLHDGEDDPPHPDAE